WKSAKLIKGRPSEPIATESVVVLPVVATGVIENCGRVSPFPRIPAGPVAPAEPASPAAPVEPVGPAAPVEPRAPRAPVRFQTSLRSVRLQRVAMRNRPLFFAAQAVTGALPPIAPVP